MVWGPGRWFGFLKDPLWQRLFNPPPGTPKPLMAPKTSSRQVVVFWCFFEYSLMHCSLLQVVLAWAFGYLNTEPHRVFGCIWDSLFSFPMFVEDKMMISHFEKPPPRKTDLSENAMFFTSDVFFWLPFKRSVDFLKPEASGRLRPEIRTFRSAEKPEDWWCEKPTRSDHVSWGKFLVDFSWKFLNDFSQHRKHRWAWYLHAYS